MNHKSALSLVANTAVALLALAIMAGEACIPVATPDPPCADGAAVCTASPTGTAPNDVVLSTCGADEVAVVVDSGDANIDVFKVPSGDLLHSIHFDGGPGPWAIAIDAARGRGVVTLRELDALAVVDVCGGKALSLATVTDAHKPQPIVFDGTRFVVGFTNVVQVSTSPAVPPVVDPGVVASFTLGDDDKLTPVKSVTLPCKNPQGLLVDTTTPAGPHVWASCSGPLGPDGAGRERATEDGALARLDGADLAVGHVINAARTAPGTPVVAAGTIYAGSIVTPTLLSAAVDGTDLSVALTFDGPAVDSVFKVLAWDSVTLLAPQFSQDALRVVHVDNAGALSVVDTVAVGPGGTAFHGLLTVDTRPGLGDVDAVGILTLSAELVPLRLHTLACCGGTP